MTAAVTRELSIVYGSQTLGGTTDRLIDGARLYTHDYINFTLTARFVTSADTEAAFSAEIKSLNAGFRKPDQRLRIIQGSETIWDLNPATNSGFNQRSSIQKVESPANTGRSQEFEISIDVELPANLSGRSGRRDSDVQVRYSPSRRRTILISGVYTALDSNDSTAQYGDAIGAYTTAVLGAFTGTYQIEEEQTERDDQDKVITFTRTYRELLANEASGTLDHAGIVQQQLKVTRITPRPGDTPSNAFAVERFTEISVSYMSAIKADVTKDLKTLWEATILPWIVEHVRSLLDASAVAVVRAAPEFEAVENTIGATVAMIASNGSGLIENEITIERNYLVGTVLIPVLDGNSLAKHEQNGPATLLQTTTERRRVLGSFHPMGLDGSGVGFKKKGGGLLPQIGAQFGGLHIPRGGFAQMNLGPFGIQGINFPRGVQFGNGGKVITVGRDGWRLIQRRPSTTVKEIGDPPDTITVTDISIVTVEEYGEKFQIKGGPNVTLSLGR